MAGEVTVNGQVVDKPAAAVADEARIQLKARPRFVSRGGEKLDAALEHFQIDVRNLTCADVGASTGGFTDCLLQRGAARVYAVDVGHGILDYRLRTDPRVVVMEGTIARYVERLPEPVQLISIDASFISLKVLLPVVRRWGPEAVALIKPQFEAGRTEVGRGSGVVRDPAIHRRVLGEVLDFAQAQGFAARGLLASPLRGPKGNVEFLVWLRVGDQPAGRSAVIEAVLAGIPPA
jgi:23S rRNA (cytidine1920-2'-O)/16S rRNA (cytidine1409-2'-O)-methyltransferase